MRIAIGFRTGLAVLLVMMSSPVWAQEVTPDDREAIRTVVQQQLDAFRHDNAAVAFSFASPSIREKFGTPETFMNMVKTAYPPVYRPRHIVFKELRIIKRTLVQPVLLVGPDNVPVTALYPMQQQPDGVWKIDGCYLQSFESKSM